MTGVDFVLRLTPPTTTITTTTTSHHDDDVDDHHLDDHPVHDVHVHVEFDVDDRPWIDDDIHHQPGLDHVDLVHHVDVDRQGDDDHSWWRSAAGHW